MSPLDQSSRVVVPPGAGLGARALPAFAFALAFAVLIARSIAHGATVFEHVAYAAGIGGLVVLPGWALVRLVGARREDRWSALGLAGVTGVALLAVVFPVLQAFGLGVGVALLPVAAIAVLATRRRAPEPAVLHRGATRPSFEALAALGLLATVVVLRSPLHSVESWLGPIDQDLWFHAGNAGALARGFPLENPRIAGEPLEYHFASYAPFAALRVVTGIPIETLYLRLAASTLPLLLLLQVFNAARAITGRPWAGVLAAAIVVLHVDPAHALVAFAQELLAREGFAWIGDLDAHAFLHFGVFRSPTTCLGLAAFATIAELLHRWFERGERRELVLLALAGLVASAAKGSIVPVVLAGLALVTVWSFVRGWRAKRASERRGEAEPDASVRRGGAERATSHGARRARLDQRGYSVRQRVWSGHAACGAQAGRFPEGRECCRPFCTCPQ